VKHSEVKRNGSFGVVQEIFFEERMGDDVSGASHDGVVGFGGAVLENHVCSIKAIDVGFGINFPMSYGKKEILVDGGMMGAYGTVGIGQTII